jgi:hypothetical protein
MRRFDEALDCFDAAIAANPDAAISHFHRAFPLLALGRFAEGFEAYEWRRRGPKPFVPLPAFPQPELEPGADLSGKRLLLYGEQGMGDIIQFVRFARIFADKGASVAIATYPALARLLATLGPDIEIIPPEGPAPTFDLTCPMMSAPHKAGTTVETIPAKVPYLSAPPDLVGVWRQRLATSAGGLRVGIAWSGNPQHPNDRARSIPFEAFGAVLDVPGAIFFCAQKDVRPSDEAALAAAGVVDYRNFLTDFAETAALVSELDVVVSVDTSLVHLAGAMGKPVFVLLSAVSDWRWLEHRSDSPWYPTARLFRQETLGAWQPVLDDVRSALADLAAQRRSGQ